MPYLSSKIKIENTQFDRRIKLTDDDKQLIKWLREEEQISHRKLAIQFGVSKRTIQFILSPEKLEQNKQRREERGGWRQYYDKEASSESQKEYRNYKENLKKKGLIK